MSANKSEDANIPANAFLIVNGSYIFPLDEPVVTIGRKADNDLVIDILHVSRYHAELRVKGGLHYLHDLDSTGGTSINGKRITQAPLQAGDVISLAGVPIIYGQSPLAKKIQGDDLQANPSLRKSSQPTKAATDSVEAASIEQFLDMFDPEDED